jgi:cbb3-type cytochrome oxidase maturation protein
MLALIVSSIVFALAGMLVYIYYFRKGQFEDPEDVKYQMFRDEDK